MLLDERRLETVPYGIYTTDRNSRSTKRWMVTLKYFDIFTQKLYFVDFVYMIKDKTTIKDVARYVEHKILNSNSYYFIKCKEYLHQINKFKSPQKGTSNDEKIRNKFTFYEEYDADEGAIHYMEYNKVIDDEFYWGDIFIFQLNPYFEYFQSDKIPLTIETTFKQSYHGTYLNADKFMLALVDTQKTE